MLTTWSCVMLIKVLCERGTRAQHAAPGKSARPDGRASKGREGYHCALPAAQPKEISAGSNLRATPMRLVYLGVFAATFPVAALAAGGGPEKKSARTPAMADNPFVQPSTLPFELPPFDRIRDSDYLPAFQAGMREQLSEVARIAHNPQPATFDNTIVALERAGQLLIRVDTAFGRLNASNTNPRMQEIDTEMAPKLAAPQAP